MKNIINIEETFYKYREAILNIFMVYFNLYTVLNKNIYIILRIFVEICDNFYKNFQKFFHVFLTAHQFLNSSFLKLTLLLI